MTADIELLPLPELASERVFGAKWDDFDIQDYARANVAHATAEKDAEIEALRAEVDEANADFKEMERLARKHKARAERLAEALRELVEVFSASGVYDAEVFDNARTALRDHDQEVGNG